MISNVSQVKSIDRFFLQLTIALIVIGAVFISSASWYESIRYTGSAWTFIIKHGVAMVLGIPAMIVVSSLNYRWWKQLAWPLAIISLVLLVLTASDQFGVVTGGSRRWLSLGFFNLQVSEFTKIATVALVSKVIFDHKQRIPALGMVALMAFLVLKQPDLGTTILIMSSVVFILYASGFNLLLFTGGLVVFGYLVWNQILSTPYQMERIKYWLDPYSDPLGHGYNLIQSQHAIGAGGLWGAGLGGSEQKLGVLPISHADFIFSIICEEIGLIGALAILALLLTWILRAFYISNNIEDEFARYLGIGLTGIFSLQVLINIGVATGLFPITGMTLPFISFGGSSFISACVLAGIIMNISRFSKTS